MKKYEVYFRAKTITEILNNSKNILILFLSEIVVAFDIHVDWIKARSAIKLVYE